MNLALGLLIFLPFLTLMISIHELAHFRVARYFGMKVTEYFIGFGPKVWSRRRGELEWGVKGLPIGGYVKIAGMSPYETNPPEDTPRLFGSKPIWQRALTIFAGPGSHFVMAAILFSAFIMLVGNPRSTVPVVGEVDATLNGKPSPAVVAGLQPGDEIIRVGELTDPTQEQLKDLTTAAAQDHSGEPLPFTIDRDGEVITVDITPQLAEVGDVTVGRIGILLGYQQPGVLASVVDGVKEVGYTAVDSVRQMVRVFGPQGIGRVFSLLFTNAPRDTTDAASLVGIGQQVGATSSTGDWATILYFFAYVTVFIGLINLVPLPPFDGGHLAMLLIEKVRGRAVDIRKLIPVSVAVMGFFAVFVTATVFLDVTKPIPIP